MPLLVITTRTYRDKIYICLIEVYLHMQNFLYPKVGLYCSDGRRKRWIFFPHWKSGLVKAKGCIWKYQINPSRFVSKRSINFKSFQKQSTVNSENFVFVLNFKKSHFILIDTNLFKQDLWATGFCHNRAAEAYAYSDPFSNTSLKYASL